MPEDWVTTETIEGWKHTELSPPLASGPRTMSLDKQGSVLLYGSESNDASIFSISDARVMETLPGDGGATNSAAWLDTKAILASSTGSIRGFENGSEIFSFSRHAGEATAVAVHPSGELIASVGVDKSIIFYDLSSSNVASQVFTDSGMLL